jgi:[CysO sulfur-carrier protein]-S-L-cysteine hydrolase
MHISSELLNQIVAHAREDTHSECCGVVAVKSGSPPSAVRVHRATNALASPLSFEIDAGELLDLWNAIERDGYELGAIYHSHVRSEPYPSQTDINFAVNWPGVEWIIVGLADGEPEVRSYLIDGGKVEEVAIEEVRSAGDGKGL